MTVIYQLMYNLYPLETADYPITVRCYVEGEPYPLRYSSPTEPLMFRPGGTF